MNNGIYRLAMALIVCGSAATACSDDASDPAGQGGSSSASNAAATTTSGTGGGTSATCPTGVYDGTSCDGFLDGCWAPDTDGTCTDSGTELNWTDGHKIVRALGTPGLYGPSDSTPCISLAFDASTNTSTLTNAASEELSNQDLGDGNIKITCPDGDEHTFTADELEAQNVCDGISCPPT